MVILQPFPVLRGKYLGGKMPAPQQFRVKFLPHHCGKYCIDQMSFPWIDYDAYIYTLINQRF
jgi:hypothetical protein